MSAFTITGSTGRFRRSCADAGGPTDEVRGTSKRQRKRSRGPHDLNLGTAGGAEAA